MSARLADHRTVSRFDGEGWERLEMPGLPGEDVWWKIVSYDEATGQGSYLMKMAPGTRCNAHRHEGPEEFFILSGDLVDHDGHAYRAGDFVSLGGGSAHYSVSRSGCELIVTHRGVLTDLSDADLEAGA